MTGFYGKLPARGDFVRAGLDAATIDELDGWMRGCIASSQDVLGDAWLDCWMEAPVWRFISRIAGVMRGGVWMPSMDRVERCFPLVILDDAARSGPGWMAAAEAAGFEAVTADLGPDRLALMLRAIESAPCAVPMQGLWWTEGAPRKQAARLAVEGLPDPAGFAGFLTDRAEASP